MVISKYKKNILPYVYYVYLVVYYFYTYRYKMADRLLPIMRITKAIKH